MAGARTPSRSARPWVAAWTALLVVALAGCSGGDGEPDETDGVAPGPGDGETSQTAGDGEDGGAGEDVPPGLVLPDSLSVSLDGSEVLADCFQGVCRWETVTGSLAEVSPGSHVAMSPDWSLRAGVLEDATVVLADPDSGSTVRELDGLEGDAASVADVVFSPDGSLVAGADLSGRVAVWTVEDGRAAAGFETGSPVRALAFAPDGRRIAVVGEESVSLHRVVSGRRLTELRGSSGEAGAVVWSPDGRWVAGPGKQGAPTVWSAEDSRRVASLAGDDLEQLAFSDDSRTLAVTADGDSVVRLWSPRALGGRAGGAGQDVRELTGHLEPPQAVAFSPDGTRVYSAAPNDGVMAWDTATGEIAVELELPRR